jgi:hypothetical protein
MTNIEKKQYLKLIFLIALLITLIIGTTYAFLNLNGNKATEGTKAGCFSVSYEGNEINATNLSTTTNYLEGAKTTLKLKKDTDCEIYTTANIYLYIDSTNTTSTLLSGDLNYIILDQNSTTIAQGVVTSTGSILLKTVSLTTTQTPYSVKPSSNRTYDNTKFVGYIYADTTQSSTINS